MNQYNFINNFYAVILAQLFFKSTPFFITKQAEINETTSIVKVASPIMIAPGRRYAAPFL